MPIVSIIVPVYKVEDYLDKCVDSLRNQTFKDIEIILVDDGSPDNCPKMCDGYALTDSRIHVIHKQNGGVSAARNDGLKIAKGAYVIFVDSDDWMEFNACEVLYNSAIRTESDVVIGDVYQISGELNRYTDFYAKEFITDDRGFIRELIKADIYRTYCPMPAPSGPAFGYGGPWNKLVKRSLLKQNNIYFDIRVKGIFDDILYTAYILSSASKISYIKKPVYNYRVITSSITHTYRPNVIEINDAIFNSWKEFFDKQRNADVYKKAFCACVLRRLEEAIRLYFVNEHNDKDANLLKKELKELVKREPYKNAISNVDLTKITKKQQLLVILSKVNMITLVWQIKIF
ncbi:MAG: glycosyltransferase [Prevotella sp.]|nr:glycosyltransferase [Prevotella sp.]